MSHLFGTAFAAQVARRPGKLAISEGDEQLSYGDLEARAIRLARALLTRGLRPGELVAVMHDGAVPMTLMFLACQYAGLGFMPLNTGLTAGEVERLAEKAGFSLMVASPSLADLAPRDVLVLTREAASGPAEVFSSWLATVCSKPVNEMADLPTDIDGEGPALVISSSGSMGVPKCVQISRAGYQRQIARQSRASGVREDGVFQLVLPLFHAAGLIGVIGVSFICGASVSARLGRFRADEALDHLVQSGATQTHWIPTMISRVVSYLDETETPGEWSPPAALRGIHFGSMQLSDQVRDGGIRWFPGLLWQSYGSTECGFISCLSPADLESGKGFTGRLEPDAGPRIIDEAGMDVPPGGVGEMVMPVEHAAMTSYIGEPERTRHTIRNGFVHSGDVVRNDGDGYFTILGRSDAVIITGGLKVYPSEVEACIMEHAGCPEVAVVGVPDPEFGELVCAVLAAGANPPPLERLRETCRPHMAAYKLPKRLEIVPELPRTGSGKIAYGELRGRFGGGSLAEFSRSRV